MSSGSAGAVVRKCLEYIKNKEGTAKIKACLEMCDKGDFLKWKDDKSLDVLHYCIIENNPEVVEYFFTHEYFVEPFDPEVNPYCHLAARLGRRTILNLIITHRSNDNRPRAASLLTYPDVFILGRTDYTVKGGEVMPLDVAASSGNLECVRQILTQCVIKTYPDHAKDGDISLATLANSPVAIKRLLSQKHEKNDLNKALEHAVHLARPECLDILLGTGMETKTLFRGVNLFHVLYTYSSAKAFGREGYKSLPDVTSVLIKHKHNVNAKTPNTYPMYSLLRNSLCAHDYVNTAHYLECLRLLLRAGANPDFDEVRYEELVRKKGHKPIVGRPAYTSALHCLLDTVEIYASFFDSKALAVKFITQCGEVLLRTTSGNNGMSAQQRARNMTGSILHHYAKASVSLGVSESVIKFFMRQGADPNCKIKGKYVINTFSDVLFARLLEVPKYKEQTDRMEDVEAMLDICYSMSIKSLKETLQIFNRDHGGKHAEQVKLYVAKIHTCLENHVKTVAPLKRMCINLVWQLCGRNANNVHSLPINIKLKTDILPIV